MDALTEQFREIWRLLSNPLFELGSHSVSIFSLLMAIALFCLALYGSRVVERLTREFLKDKDMDSGIKGSLERFARYLVVILGLLISLDTLGISLSSLAALGAVLMVGIGFGLQNIAQNFISGLIILLERPIKHGDLIQVGSTTGRVVDIRGRSTLIQTRDDISIIVPNSEFIAQQVVNSSFSGDKIRLHVRVGVAYGSDVDLVRTVLLRVASENPNVLNDPLPQVIFENFGESSLDFDLRVWVTDLWANDVILSDLRFVIDREFRKSGITIPFPQRDLHLHNMDAH